MQLSPFRSRVQMPMTVLALAGMTACGADIEQIVKGVEENAAKQPPTMGPGAPAEPKPEPAQPPPPRMAASCVAPGEVPERPLKLPPAQVAERLAQALWGAPADDGLVAAVTGAQTNHDLAPVARKMVADPRASKRLGDIIARWLRLAPTPLAGDAASSAAAALVRGDATLTSLLTGPVLASDPAAVALAAETGRRGITMHPGVLASHPRASARGSMVREALLCQSVPPPPANVSAPLAPSAGVTYRQRLENATSDPVCSGCHKLTDPPGFTYEGFDEAGRARTTDNGQRVDTSALIDDVFGDAFSVANAAELVSALADRCEVQTCVANRWLALAAGGDAPSSADVAGVASAFAAAKLDLRELLVAIAQSEAVLGR